MSRDIVSWLIKQDVCTVGEWLRMVWSGEQAIPENFNWQYLAATLEVLAKSGQNPQSNIPDLEWTKVALAVFAYLTNHTDPISRIWFEDRAMELKAYCIVHLGMISGDPILDVTQLVTWFFQRLPFSLQEAKSRCEHLQIQNDDMLRMLRDIKNRAYFLNVLTKKGAYLPDGEMKEWLSLTEKMP